MEASKLVSCGPSLPRRATFLGGENGEMKRGTPRHPKTYALAEGKTFVYAIQRDGEIKLGYSTNPFRRAKCVSAARLNPHIIAMRESDDPRSDEKFLHFIFRNFHKPGRVGGEWFFLEPADVVEVFRLFHQIRSTIKIPPDFSLVKFKRGSFV